MSLNQFAAENRMAIFQDLLAGIEPRIGSFEPKLLAEAPAKGHPQMGTTRYEPDAIVFEFIYPDPLGSPVIVAVTLNAPERIVFLPVPSWVVENIWQGDVAGAYHFETDANRLLRELESELTPDSNRKWFGRQPPKRRE